MKLRLSLVSAALLVGALPVALSTPAACAAETPHAALVVDTGESDVALCVALPDESVTGIDLIRLANEQHGLQYTLGYGGKAVCRLAGVGPEGDDCFADYPDFWGYWHGDGDGGWTWSSTGAGTTTVQDGDVEGWSWGSGQDGSSHPAPPATTLEAVCGAQDGVGDEPEQNDASMNDADDTGDESNDVAAGPSSPTTGGNDETAADEADPTRGRGGSEPNERDRTASAPEADPTDAPAPTPEQEPHVALVAGSEAAEDPGPPVAGLVGLGLAIGLGITAAAMTAARRRRKT